MPRKKTGRDASIHICLTPALKREVEAFAASKGLDVSAVGRMALREYLDRSRKEEKKP